MPSLAPVFSEFEATGGWPDPRELHRRALRADPEVNLLRVARAMPFQLGAMEDRGNQVYRVVLTIRGISFCPGAVGFMADFVKVVRLAWDLYLDDDPKPVINNEILRERLQLGETKTSRIEDVFRRERYLLAGLQADAAGTWEGQISDEIQAFRSVERIDQYLDVQARLMTQSSSAVPVRPLTMRRGSEQPSASGLGPAPAVERVDSTPDARRVWVVFGRNRAARDGVFEFLRALRLDPIEWDHAMKMTGEASPYTGAVLEQAFAEAQAVVVLLTPDEVAYLRPEYSDGDADPESKPSCQARPNVLFEAGMSMGLHPDRTVLVELGHVRPFSDVVGRHLLRLDNTPEMRTSFAERLRTAHCEVDTSGRDWLSAGDLTPPPPPGGGLPLGRRVPESSMKGAVRFDLQYHERGSGSGQLQVINRGIETAFDVNVELPPEAGTTTLVTDELPLAKLPPGKSASFLVSRTMGPGKNHFDVRVSARTADGTPIDEDVYVSLGG